MKRIALVLLTLILLSGFTTCLAADSSATREQYLRTQISTANTFISDSAVKQSKYAAMSQTPFQFYRATAHLYYSDLGSSVIPVPTSWKTTSQIKTWLQGDFHTQNIGYFDNKNGQIVFDLNDGDESYLGPFYWDLLRFATSIWLLGDEVSGFNLTSSERSDLVQYFLQEYQNTLASVNGNSSETTTQLDKSYLSSGFVQDKLSSLESSRTLSTLLSKWTVLSSGVRKFNLANTDLASVTSTERANILNNWAGYKQSIASFVSTKSSSYFNVKDVARRLNSGLGSLGVAKFYVLVEGDGSSQNDDQVLELKEQRQPALFNEGSTSVSQYNAWFVNQGVRSQTALKADGIKVDDHLGVETFGAKPYRVARISPWKDNFDSTSFKSQTDLKNFLKYSAQALAFAHARSDKDYSTTYLNYNFENGALNAITLWPQFKTTLATLAEQYYYQVWADFGLFKDLLTTGQL